MDQFRRLVAQRLVRALCVVEGEVLGQANRQLAHRSVALQIHVFMLDVPLEALDEDVVEHSSAPIHTDDDAFASQHVGKSFAGELRALIAVEDCASCKGCRMHRESDRASRLFRYSATLRRHRLCANAVCQCGRYLCCRSDRCESLADILYTQKNE